MSTITNHLVTRDPRAGRRVVRTGARRDGHSRIRLPGGRLLTVEQFTVEQRFGDSVLAIADEFPDMGIVSPLTLGGTYGALHLAVDDAEAVWQWALGTWATVFERWRG